LIQGQVETQFNYSISLQTFFDTHHKNCNLQETQIRNTLQSSKANESSQLQKIKRGFPKIPFNKFYSFEMKDFSSSLLKEKGALALQRIGAKI
jgi:hypothetical protein